MVTADLLWGAYSFHSRLFQWHVWSDLLWREPPALASQCRPVPALGLFLFVLFLVEVWWSTCKFLILLGTTLKKRKTSHRLCTAPSHLERHVGLFPPLTAFLTGLKCFWFIVDSMHSQKFNTYSCCPPQSWLLHPSTTPLKCRTWR